ncbi:hypothetical protein [Streptomyces nodosus]|uniref:Uncharacterized protein n=1 Tax=Streptomyces nodosus TaxID=40318 RepID=A0A5P2WF43_9ACTN|nr:hypothetical protein [Streptomyces nodosus]MBB4794901.1 hypothetical protein [Streptomyces nodosus]QEV41949.1 hypothetical protein CP978_28325 [Streptomyces nodosus]
MNAEDTNDATTAEPTVLAVNEARTKANNISSQILDLIGIKEGKVAGGGAGVSLCDEDPDHLYLMRHPWSIYEVKPDTLEAGFQRLREKLPKNGWKVVAYGRDTSANKNLELTADSEKDPFSVNVSLHVTGPSGTKEPMIQVNVVSGCFRAPEGTDLNKEF